MERHNTNAARIRVEGMATLVCQECGRTVARLDPGDRFDMMRVEVADHERACPGHPSGIHYEDRT